MTHQPTTLTASAPTPGPWDIGNHADDRIAIWATDVTVAFAYDVDDGRLAANARLIAAAPELLEALTDLERYLRHTCHHNAIEAAAARKAIARVSA
jgi:hypothetical protein